MSTRTLAPITIVPERASITTLATLSGCTIRFSTAAIISGVSPLSLDRTSMVVLSRTCAVPPPRDWLILSATRFAVVMSGLRNATRKDRSEASRKSISFSTVAPFSIRATVGTPSTIEALTPCAA